MKSKILVCGVLLSLSVSLSAETITLQQGLNGYTGCMDTHIENLYKTAYPDWGFAVDYGADTVLGVAYENYNYLGSNW